MINVKNITRFKLESYEDLLGLFMRMKDELEKQVISFQIENYDELINLLEEHTITVRIKGDDSVYGYGIVEKNHFLIEPEVKSEHDLYLCDWGEFFKETGVPIEHYNIKDLYFEYED